MMSDTLMKAALDKLIADNAARAKEHGIEITFEYFGQKYTVRPPQHTFARQETVTLSEMDLSEIHRRMTRNIGGPMGKMEAQG